MKKTYFLLPLVAALASCSKLYNPALRKTDLKIISPQGAPAVAMYNFVNGLTTSPNPATGVIPQFLLNEFDVIVAPAKGGLTNIVKKGASYKMAAVVTFGNFALVSTGNDDDGELNEGDKVLYFQPSDIPGSVFTALYGNLGLETYSVDDVKATATALGSGNYKIDETTTVKLDYVFSAEPLITNLGKTAQVKEWATEAFAQKFENKRIIQAAVFVSNNADSEKIDEFLTLLEGDMQKAVNEPKEIVNTFNLYGDKDEQENMFGVNATTVYNCMKDHNGLGLGYLRAKDAQSEIDFFINDILNTELTLDEEVYY